MKDVVQDELLSRNINQIPASKTSPIPQITQPKQLKPAKTEPPVDKTKPGIYIDDYSDGEEQADIFDHKKGKYQINLSENKLVATRKKYFSDGGLVFLSRPLNTAAKINTFKFWINKSTHFHILIGLQKENPKEVWFIKLDTGEFCLNSQTNTEEYFSKTNSKIKEGDVIKMVTENN